MFYDNDDDDGGYKGFSSYTIHTFAIERHVCALSSIEVTVFIVVAATYRRSRRVYKYTSPGLSTTAKRAALQLNNSDSSSVNT